MVRKLCSTNGFVPFVVCTTNNTDIWLWKIRVRQRW